MGIESGPSGDLGFSRESRRIEGEVERSLSEIDIDQASHIPLPAQIVWSEAIFSFKETATYRMPMRFGMSEGVQLYAGQLDYVGPKGARKSNLSLLTSKRKPVLFTGTRNGFYAHDPLMAGRSEPFYVVGLQLNELEESIKRMAGTWHELGHVSIFHENADTALLKAAVSLKRKDLPKVAFAEGYGNAMAQAVPRSLREDTSFDPTRQELTRLEARNHDVNKINHIFHERNAWARGMRIVRKNRYPLGYEDPHSYFDYARLCLKSYERHYGDKRFTEGWQQSYKS